MTDREMTFEVTDNRGANRFELHRDGELVGFASYRRTGDIVTVPHVETLPSHRGQGFAALLMEGLLAQLRERGERIVPICPFAADHIAADPAHHDLLAR